MTRRSTAGHHYRIERLSIPLVVRDLYFTRHDPKPGDTFPAFDLPLLGGGRFAFTDLMRGRPTLVVFGSLTCPVTEDAAPGLRSLHRQFGDAVRIVLVYVREAHPGASLPQPQDATRKRVHAERLRTTHAFHFEIAVDDLDGSLHRAVGPKPNSAYLIGTKGEILFRAHWANDAAALRDALAAVVRGYAPVRRESGGLIRPMARMIRHVVPVLDRAGAGAWRDLWRVAPPIALIARLVALVTAPTARRHPTPHS